MNPNATGLLLAGAIATLLAGCGGGAGGGGGGSTSMPAPQSGTLSVLASDASAEDWAMIGVRILSVALVPTGGGAAVTVYTAPSPVPYTNLVDLDNLSELLGNASIVTDTPVSFDSAIVTLSANPGDVMLTAAADPQAGFQGTPGATVPAAQVQIQGATGTAPDMTVTVAIRFDAPLQVTPGQASQLDVEFDLRHPAFIVAHAPPAAQGTTIWAVNFNGPVRHHPVPDIARLVLRHLYGAVASLSQDGTSITIDREAPTEPPVSPETAQSTGQSVTILADATNGTLLYDLDAKTRTTIMGFANLPTLAGAQVRVAARYQAGGKLVASRIWFSSAANAFNNVWASPEGHVLHVNTSTDVITIENESGRGVPVSVDDNTQFFFRAPQDPQADVTPIGTGTGFLANHNLVRGFKVHASVVDPLAASLVAQSIDIEAARYDGAISAPSASAFTYTHAFRTPGDDYSYTLGFAAGFQWWYFAYPTVLDLSIGDWVGVTNDAVNLGGTIGPIPTYGVSYAVWNDPANADTWSTNASIIVPSRLPLAVTASGLTSGNTFTMTVPGSAVAATVDVSAASGSATLVYQVDRTGGIVTLSAIDITTAGGLATLTAALANAATPVRVYGVPQQDGSVRAYVLTYFTGTMLPAG